MFRGATLGATIVAYPLCLAVFFTLASRLAPLTNYHGRGWLHTPIQKWQGRKAVWFMSGWTHLHVAARNGDLERVRDYVEANGVPRIEIEAADACGRTALHIASKWNRLTVAEYLVRHDADIYTCTVRNENALALAASDDMRSLLESVYTEVKNSKFETIASEQRKTKRKMAKEEFLQKLDRTAKEKEAAMKARLAAEEADRNAVANEERTCRLCGRVFTRASNGPGYCCHFGRWTNNVPGKDGRVREWLFMWSCCGETDNSDPMGRCRKSDVHAELEADPITGKRRHLDRETLRRRYQPLVDELRRPLVECDAAGRSVARLVSHKADETQ